MACARRAVAGGGPAEEPGHQGGHDGGGRDGGIVGSAPSATNWSAIALSVAAVPARTAGIRLGLDATMASRSRTGSSSVIGSFATPIGRP